MSKSKSLRGIVRISNHYNNPWRGFTLQRGHFYGETKDGKYFVSGLERSVNKNVKVYFCDTSSGDYVWTATMVNIKDPLIQDIIRAIPQRQEMGINGIEFKPLDKEDGGFHPQLTTSAYIPYKHMHIPNAGRPTKTTFLFVNGKSSIIQNYV